MGVRTEIKNIGSVRAVAAAIKYEISRQISILEAGNEIFNETRAWDAVNKTTIPMREKEDKEVIYHFVFMSLFSKDCSIFEFVVKYILQLKYISGLPIYA